jgi:hypothetical protein
MGSPFPSLGHDMDFRLGSTKKYMFIYDIHHPIDSHRYGRNEMDLHSWHMHNMDFSLWLCQILSSYLLAPSRSGILFSFIGSWHGFFSSWLYKKNSGYRLRWIIGLRVNLTRHCMDLRRGFVKHIGSGIHEAIHDQLTIQGSATGWISLSRRMSQYMTTVLRKYQSQSSSPQ